MIHSPHYPDAISADMNREQGAIANQNPEFGAGLVSNPHSLPFNGLRKRDQPLNRDPLWSRCHVHRNSRMAGTPVNTADKKAESRPTIISFSNSELIQGSLPSGLRVALPITIDLMPDVDSDLSGT
jgi:hypothetical protein